MWWGCCRFFFHVRQSVYGFMTGIGCCSCMCKLSHNSFAHSVFNLYILEKLKTYKVYSLWVTVRLMHTKLWTPCDDPWIDSTQQVGDCKTYLIQFVDTASFCLGCLNWCLVVSTPLNVYFDIFQALSCSLCFKVSSADCLAATCLCKITAWKTKIGDTLLHCC
mgnify:CR=1 FL=1